MKQLFNKLLTVLLMLSISISAVACGGGASSNIDSDKPSTSDSNSEKEEETLEGTINFYTAVNIIEQQALEAVANAYMDMQYLKGNDVTVIINNNTDPDAYASNMRNMISKGISGATIAQASVTPEYYGTDKILDFTPYLEEPNPYISGNEMWLDALESDAYRTEVVGSSSTIPVLSYSSNYVTLFYNKQAMSDVMGDSDVVDETGTIDQSKFTWDWMMDALQSAKDSGLNFKNPLAVSSSQQSTGEDNFNMFSVMAKTYMDQYFRDFASVTHSQEGDYSYIESIDSVWEYDENDYQLDYADKYTKNVNRTVDAFFNQDTYAPTSARYTELMKNLYDLFRYADSEASYLDNFSRFNETTIVFEEKGGKYQDMKLFYVETLGYVRTYRDAFKVTNGEGVTVFPDSEKINSELGWVLLPAMESDLEGVASNARPVGGPNENFGVLTSGTQSEDDLAVDFMQYLYSPVGQDAIYSTYVGNNNAPVVMRPLVKGASIPSVIDFTGLVNTDGDCSKSPYLTFAKGGDLSNYYVGESGDYAKDLIAKEFTNYLRGDGTDWQARGTEIYRIMKETFANYAEDKAFIYTDYTKVKEVTNNLINSPYDTAN